jgi:hypothetical protein
MATQQKKCQHPACNCILDEGDNNYCSPYCHDAGDKTELMCNCGHVGCVASEATPRTMKGKPV